MSAATEVGTAAPAARLTTVRPMQFRKLLALIVPLLLLHCGGWRPRGGRTA